MSKKEIKKTIIKIIMKKFDIKENEINKKNNIVDDLGLDSLDIVELVMNIEEKLKINIEDSFIEKINNIDELVEFIYNIKKK